MNQAPAANALDVIGECFVRFCRRQTQEFLLKAFTADLQAVLAGASAREIYRWGGAQDDSVYFTDIKEANPQRYWRITCGANQFLVPKPLNLRRFDDGNRPRGFLLPPKGEISPGSLRELLPAILTGDGHRWELRELGALNQPTLAPLISVPGEPQVPEETPIPSVPIVTSGLAAAAHVSTDAVSNFRAELAMRLAAVPTPPLNLEMAPLAPLGGGRGAGLTVGSHRGSPTPAKISEGSSPGLRNPSDRPGVAVLEEKAMAEQAYVQFCRRIAAAPTANSRTAFEAELLGIGLTASVKDVVHSGIYSPAGPSQNFVIASRDGTMACPSDEAKYWLVKLTSGWFIFPKVAPTCESFLDLSVFKIHGEFKWNPRRLTSIVVRPLVLRENSDRDYEVDRTAESRPAIQFPSTPDYK